MHYVVRNTDNEYLTYAGDDTTMDLHGNITETPAYEFLQPDLWCAWPFTNHKEACKVAIEYGGIVQRVVAEDIPIWETLGLIENELNDRLDHDGWFVAPASLNPDALPWFWAAVPLPENDNGDYWKYSGLSKTLADALIKILEVTK